MHTASATRTIDAPAPAVWAVVDDFDGVAAYNPNVESARFTSEVETGAGASRRCTLSDGGHLDETIVAYDPGRAYAVDADGSFPLRALRVEIAVVPRGEDRAAVTVTARYVPRYGPLGWVLATVLLRRRFETLFDGTLRGLDRYVTTGRAVGTGGALEDDTAVAE
jgi:uncharacterized protein YndB with AHSA1/START domain